MEALVYRTEQEEATLRAALSRYVRSSVLPEGPEAKIARGLLGQLRANEYRRQRGAPAELEVIEIARCPTHGLHGERSECFVCAGPVEQVPMVLVEEVAPDGRVAPGANRHGARGC